MDKCVFCNKEEIITGFIYEDEKVMAFMDMDPINEGHVLIVTKEHYLDIIIKCARISSGISSISR